MLCLSMDRESSNQQNEMRSNSRTGNMAIISNAMTQLVAESRSVGVNGVTRNVCARTSHYVGFDRQSHDFD